MEDAAHARARPLIEVFSKEVCEEYAMHQTRTEYTDALTQAENNTTKALAILKALPTPEEGMLGIDDGDETIEQLENILSLLGDTVIPF